MKIDHYKNKKSRKTSQSKQGPLKQSKSNHKQYNNASLRLQKPVSLNGLEFAKTLDQSKLNNQKLLLKHSKSRASHISLIEPLNIDQLIMGQKGKKSRISHLKNKISEYSDKK
jgi:hypothetical protein